MVKKSKRAVSAVLTLAMFTTVLSPAAMAAGDGVNPVANGSITQGTAVYGEVLDTYEAQFQDSVRFTAEGKTDVTGEEWYADSETAGVNRERAHSQFVPYQDAATGLAAEESVLDETGREASSYYRLLSGKEWDFALVRTPEEAAQKDGAYLAESYAGGDFTPEYVPQAWQTYRNEDGTFKYFDEPMYTNHPFPWIGNFENVDYNNPSAPTEYNPVGYYRTTFTTPEDWDGRETFLSFQSVESAYYVYVNGQCVGYSTDCFTAHDFDVTPYLKPAGKENTLALKVFRWSIGSWLENQDFIRQSGIYRDVYLYSKGEAEIRDFFVKTAFKNRTSVDSDVDVTVETDVRGLTNAEKGEYTVSAYLVDDAGETVATAKDETVTVAAAGATPADKLKDAGAKATTAFTVTNPKKWFTDTPNLYRLVLQLKKGGSVIETAVQRIGFREIYKVLLGDTNNEQMQITGEELILRGTNRHDTDLEKGHAVGFEGYKKDLMLMKQMNINAIRTSHYPNDQALYDLADELGLYVCAEANVESHRAAMNGIDVPTGLSGTDGLAEWVPPVLDRTATMTERYKNHASIVIWSLGNEATYSQPNLTSSYCFWVSSMYLLARDPSRIRKYEREGNRGYSRPSSTDPWSLDSRKNCIIDVSSTQYATPAWSQGYNGQLPFIHSEYNHAMGQAYGNAMEHWDSIRANESVQGGFIWDWIDQSVETTKDSNGDGELETFWGYGGDWIDPVANDNAFCGNGIAYADHTAGPMTLEARKVHQQVNFYLPEDGAATPNASLNVQVVNELENTVLNNENFAITWTLTEDGKTVLQAPTDLELDIPAMRGTTFANTDKGGNAQTVQITLPEFTPKEGSDYLLTFSVKYKEAKPWTVEGDLQFAYEQFQLSVASAAEAAVAALATAEGTADFTAVTESGSTMTLTGKTEEDQTFTIELNTATGQLTTYALDGKTIITAGPELSLWRPQTYNEGGYNTWSMPLQNAGDPRNMTNQSVVIDKISGAAEGSTSKVTMKASGSLKVDADSSMILEIYGNGDIVVQEQFLPKSDFAPTGLPKVGTRMIVDKAYQNFNWYGRGPWETYSDRKSGALVGTYTSTVDEQYDMKLLKPQENGNHTDVRWTSLTDDTGMGLLVSAGNGNVVEVAALHNTAEEINSGTYNNADHRHPVDIQQRDDVVWSIDLRQDGVGDTGFSTPYPIDKYKIHTNQNYIYSYRISPIKDANTDVMAKSKEVFTPETVESQVTMIKANGENIPGFSPVSRNITYEVPPTVGSVEITAESSGDVTITSDPKTGKVTVMSVKGDAVETYTIKLVRAKKQMTGSQAFSKAVTNNQTNGYPASNMIDGSTETFWDFAWGATNKWDMSQLYYAVELNTPTLISSVGYIPRQDNQTNGNFLGHEIYVSTKPIDELGVGPGLVPDLTSGDWTQVSAGVWDGSKAWKDDVVTVTEPVTTILVQPTSTANSPAAPSDSFGCGAETRVSVLRDAKDAAIALDASYPLTGGKAEPNPIITADGTTLIQGVDYTLSYADNTAAGTGKVTVTYQGQFFGDPVTKPFTIAAPAVGQLVSGISINGVEIPNFIYTTLTYTKELPFDTADVAVTADVIDGASYTVEMTDTGAKVIATKGETTVTYTITITRAQGAMGGAPIGGTGTFSKAVTHDNGGGTSPAAIFDENSGSYWENSWNQQTVKEAYVALELNSAAPLTAVQYLPRQDASQKNGRFLQYEVYVSEKPLSELIVNQYPTDLTGDDWLKAAEGTWASDITRKTAELDVKGMNVKSILIQPVTTDTKDGRPNSFGCAAEITVTPSISANDAKVTMNATYPLVNGVADPDPVITLGGITLKRGVDYTVTSTNNTEVGKTATATITYIGRFAGASDVKKTFTVGAAAAALAAPSNPKWDGAKATWDAVEYAAGYSVQLYKDGAAAGPAYSSAATTKSFAGIISQSGRYTFAVKALGNGVTYADGPLSAKSGEYAHEAAYTVTLTPGYGYTLVASEGSGTPVAEGGSFSFTLTVEDGYNAASAPTVLVNGEVLAADPLKTAVSTYTIKNIAENKTVTVAGIVKDTFTVAFMADDETVDEKKVEYGGSVLLRDFPKLPEKAGYTGVWDKTTNITGITENMTVTAVYTAIDYTVTFDPNGGAVEEDSRTVTFGAPYGTLPTPTHEDPDKIFDGWFTESAAGAAITGETAVATAGDHTLYAHWRDRGTSEAPNTVITGMPEKIILPYEGGDILLTAPEAPEGSAYTYQWQCMTDSDEWVEQETETASTYTISADTVLYENSGWQYKCVVTNTQGDMKPNTAESLPVTLNVQKGFQSAPAALTGLMPTAKDAEDGRILGLNASEKYEYKLKDAESYTPVSANATEITALAAGVYLVRLAGDDDYQPSADAEVQVPVYSINLDMKPLETAIEAAKTAKSDVTVSDQQADQVSNGTKFVTQAVMDALDAAIAAAETAKGAAESEADVAAAVTALNTATETFTAAVQVGTRRSSHSSSGGSTPSTSTKTEKNADGSTTSTVTDQKTGDAVATTTYPNGTKIVTDIPKNGEPVSKITVPAGKSETVTVPADKLTAGTVAVIMHDDGTNEIIKTSVRTEDGIRFLTSGNVTVKLVDNSKTFVDVPQSSWAAESVQFAASRELFNGTGANTFSPETDMSRAMLVTVLARLDGQETSGGAAWYSKAADWAKAEGITDGTDLQANITREALAVMLYRYAGKPETKAMEKTFADGESVSAWAADAIGWCVNSGILNGKSGNVLDPQGFATRAEVAAMLMRFITHNVNG